MRLQKQEIIQMRRPRNVREAPILGRSLVPAAQVQPGAASTQLAAVRWPMDGTNLTDLFAPDEGS